MTEAYKNLRTRADGVWGDLHDPDIVWVRVGTTICGRSINALGVVEKFRTELSQRGIKSVVSEVGCLGLCYAEPLVDIRSSVLGRVLLGPVHVEGVSEIVDTVIVNGNANVSNVIGSFEKSMEGVPMMSEIPGWANQHRVALRNVGQIDPGDAFQYLANEGYAALDAALSDKTPEEILTEVRASGLRGRGGAFFNTGTKWGFLVPSPSSEKYILCNCEEGDPGAYNDKGILEGDPHTVLEGLALAGFATGASNGIIFIRHGHDGPIGRTKEAIRQAYELGLIGKNILGTEYSFDIEVSLVGESYVSGEETALMEAVEGKPARPRSRPPFPAAVGVWGKPSNINNVKTLSYVPEIIRRGGEWFSNIGVNLSKGTAILCLSGHISRRGMYEVDLGMTLQEVMDVIGGGVPGGRKVKMLQTGGPLGGLLSADKLDTVLDFEAMRAAGAILGSGGIIYGDETVCAVDLTRLLIAFCQFESCGKCFPCRLGMTHLLDMIERIRDGRGRQEDLELMRRYGASMQAGSLCGHGQLGFNPVQSAFRDFMEDFLVHINEQRCPTGSCNQYAVNPLRTRPGPEATAFITDPYLRN